MTIDFYGRFQKQTVLRADGSSRVGYSNAEGGTSFGADPIALLRGAPNSELARAFIEYVMTDGQKIWGLKAGAPGGPKEHALFRLPILPALYGPEYAALSVDPAARPYDAAKSFTYHGSRTGRLFPTIAFVIRVMCIDTHPELLDAWEALIHARRADGTFPPEAWAKFSDVSCVDYAQARDNLSPALSRRASKIVQVQLAEQLATKFRANYRAAARLAREGK
jgi:spermidine/putrescine-binding protein